MSICVGNLTFFQIFNFNTLFPICVGVALYAHYYRNMPSPRNKEKTREHPAFYCNAMLMLLFLVYPGTSKNVVSLFNCEWIQISATETKAYLIADYSVQCWEGEHASYLVMGVIMIFLYPIGIPV